MLRYVRLPFFTRREVQEAILERCTRVGDCLIYTITSPRTDSRNHQAYIRGKGYNVLRVLWSMTCDSVAKQEALETHDVGHIASCPHTGTHGTPLCVETSHLCLVTASERSQTRDARREQLT